MVAVYARSPCAWANYRRCTMLASGMLNAAPTVEAMYSRMALVLTPTAPCHWPNEIAIEAAPEDTFLNQFAVLHMCLALSGLV